MWISPSEHKVVGQVLAQARYRAGLHQSEVAKALGKPQSFVSSYENGQRRIDVLELIRIAAALDLPVDALFSEIVSACRNP